MPDYRKLIIASVLFISFSIFYKSLSAQNMNETIDYINNILKVNSALFKVSGVVGGHGPIESYDKISVDAHGKIEINTYEVDKNADSIINKDKSCYGYLRSLLVQKGVDVIDPKFSTCRLILYCSDLNSRCMICQTGASSKVYFLINDKDARDRLLNAFSHLIRLARENPRYYDHDPFGN